MNRGVSAHKFPGGSIKACAATVYSQFGRNKEFLSWNFRRLENLPNLRLIEVCSEKNMSALNISKPNTDYFASTIFRVVDAHKGAQS